DEIAKADLIAPVRHCEAGGHLDNVAPGLLGGIIHLRSYEPLEIEELGGVNNLIIVDVAPDFIVNTAEARKGIPPKEAVLEKNAAYLDGLLEGVRENDAAKVGANVIDLVVEPLRKHLIPGFDGVKAAAMGAGALGCSISGAGPAMFAVTDDPGKARSIASAMGEAFAENGAGSTAYVSRINPDGAIRIR
ncbi:MAG: homoserine kinase, partial [Planctomycetota bacterium]